MNTPTYMFPDKKIRSSKWSQYVHLAIMILAVWGISLFAVFYSLGYQFNWITGSIQQTGLIALNPKVNKITADVYVNNSVVASELPFRSGPLFPGIFEVQIKKPGYQSWSRTFRVTENQVENFKEIVLVRDPPLPVPVGKREIEILARDTLDTEGIQIQQNEIRINGKFITRTSGDILSASWYTDREHIIYQTDKALWMAARDGLYSQKLLDLDSDEPLIYRFLNNGQVLVYSTSSGVKAVQIY